MTNLKELAEILLRAHNSEDSFNSIVAQMNSSSNTVKDDIDKLRDGARLEVTFDINKIYEMVESIEGYISSARDDANSAADCAQEAAASLDEADYEISQLLAMVETAQQELKRAERKEEVKNEKDE
jgi:uncharacterized phage infection (PIP) family protein YhgE